MSEYLIGIDCAAQHRNIGLALGQIDGSRVSVLDIVAGETDVGPVLGRWTRQYGPKIYALDAPLGWPAAMGAALHTHQAGEGLVPESHALFRRVTDDFVYAKLGKRPLEVGADRIARAAVTTLKLLERLRAETGETLPMLWTPAVPRQAGVIEVYPAATLMAREISIRGYKGNKAEHRRGREVLADRLAEHLEFAVEKAVVTATDHALDAAVCVLAAADFARGCVNQPNKADGELARKEGWIWFAGPEALTERGAGHPRL